MKNTQAGILADTEPHGRYLLFNLKPEVSKSDIYKCLKKLHIDKHIVIGLGLKTIEILALCLQDYRQFPELDTTLQIPATHGDLFVFIRNEDPGKIALSTLKVRNIIDEYFYLNLLVDGFRFMGAPGKNGHDLTGYEDGTENPKGKDAVEAVVRPDGSTFVVLQQWKHDLNHFNSFSQQQKDFTIGRRLSDNKELSDAPKSSHVNRTDQGTFEIDAEILRRSMPWSNEKGNGLMFMAYCKNLNRFEVQLERMCGIEDNINDALFSFTQAINGAYFYCPATSNNQLDI